jgi:hypothetical protein
MNKLSWDAWLNEYVSWGASYLPRSVAIHRFVTRGLVPFLESIGYRLYSTPRALQSRIATGLYNNQGLSCLESNWSIAQENAFFLEHDQYHFWHVVDPDSWAAFWDEWGQWTDVSKDSWRGGDRRIDIEQYVWSQINLDESPQTRVVNEHLGISDDYAEDGGRETREDIYLREAADSGEWGGYRK